MGTKRRLFALSALAKQDSVDPNYFTNVYLKRARSDESLSDPSLGVVEARRDRIPPCEFCNRDLYMFTASEREHHVLACQEKYRALSSHYNYCTAPDVPSALQPVRIVSLKKKISDFFTPTVVRLSSRSLASPALRRVQSLVAVSSPLAIRLLFSSAKVVPNKNRVPGTAFIVDGFQFTVPNCYYFLSHYHSDHYGPLKSTFQGYIFCSTYTAKLLEEYHGVAASSIYPLSLQCPYHIGECIVTCIDANHCPGAVMFLFEGPSGSFLHTGDFRFHFSHLCHPALKPYLTERTLDALYLDTTYFSPEYCFPPQSKVIHKVVKTVQSFHDGKTVFYFGTYTIGKERLFVEVARHFKVRFHVSKRQYQILSAQPWPFDIHELLTTDPESLFNVSSMAVAGMKSPYHYQDESIRYVGFLPTGWTMKFSMEHLAPNKYLFRVPYSEHSSYEELNTFCSRVFYRTLVSTVAPNAKVLKFFRATHACPS